MNKAMPDSKAPEGWLITMLEEAAERASNVAGKASDAAGRVCSPVPENEEGKVCESEPSRVAGVLRRCINALACAEDDLDRLMDAVR